MRLETNARAFPVAALIEKTARITGLPRSAITGPRKIAPLVKARWAVIRAARRTTDRSLSQIGRVLGGRDHSTIINGARRAETLIAADPEFARLCGLLEEGKDK